MALKVLCSSFFGRPLPLIQHWTRNTISNNIMKQILFIYSNILLQDSEKVEETMCCIGFGPSHDVLQELLEVENADDLWSTKKPIATNCRREDYVRLPFVDDLCLRCAMQDFLRRKPSSQAKLTGRQIRSSQCQRCHNQSILPCYLITEGLSITSEVFT